MLKAADLDLDTLLEAIDRLETVFALYDKDHRLIFANESARQGWPDLYEGLADGLSQYEATRNEISRQFPDHPAEKIEEYTQYTDPPPIAQPISV